jgi:serine/threonine protein kinase
MEDLMSDETSAASGTEGLPVVPGFEILEEIGRGGMGVVFRARQESSGRLVALKMVSPQTMRELEARQRFLMEVEAMAAVQHPALIPLYDAGEDARGRPWLAMMHAAGGSLAERLPGFTRQWRRSAELLVTLARAVAYAHERGLLHRDLKPANVLFDAAEHPYIADFGLAKWADEDGTVTRAEIVLGSPAYLAPEAAEGGSKATTTVSDVYGLGAILYELLSGSKPYEGTSAPEIITRIIDQAPQALRSRLPEIPRDLEIIVHKAMAREPAQRYASASAMADDLQRWLDGVPILARPLGPLGRLTSWARRKPALASLSALLVLSLLLGTLLLWRANRRLQASLNDAEARVEFMTRELPATLAPMGRLDLLDKVFANAAEHFEQNPGKHPDQWARRADFLSQWSQILLPRGDTKAAIARLEEALAQAETAVSGTARPGLPASRARVLAGWRMGEALIKDRQWERAEMVLLETRRFADRQKTKDLQLRVLVAQLALEPAFLELGRGRPDAALAPAMESLDLWADLLPELERDPASPHHQLARITAAQAHSILAEVHRARNDPAAQDEALRASLESSARLLESDPQHPLFVYQRAETLLVAGQFMRSPPEETRRMVEEADRMFSALMEQDFTNIRWRNAAIESAMKLNALAKERGDEAERNRWALLADERVRPLYRMAHTDLEYLRSRARYAWFCGNYQFRLKNWDDVRLHWTAALRAMRQTYRQQPREADLMEMNAKKARAKELLAAALGEEAAEAWLQQVDKETP